MKLPILVLGSLLMLYPLHHQQEHYVLDNSKQQRYHQGYIKKTKVQEFNCLVSLLYYEAVGEPFKGIKYVMSVVENRKNSQRYPDSYCDVMLQPKQFSFIHERLNQGLSLEVQAKPAEKKKIDFIHKVAYDAVQGKFESYLPSNVLHYTTTKVSNRWTRKKKVYTVEGNHKFYLSSR